MAKMLIPKETYQHLSPIGREMHDYWMKWEPKMYKEMHQAGTLEQIVASEDDRLHEMIIDLMQQGLAEDQAKEIARAEFQNPMMD